MALLVVAFPELEDRDFQWIQTIRAKSDLINYPLIEPHFTLIFPTQKIEQNAFIAHVRDTCRRTIKIDFVIRCASVVVNRYEDIWHVFLVPDEGYSDIVKLHDHLYTGIMEEQLKLDIPYIPHIGIANSENKHRCRMIADDINSRPLEIKGKIPRVSIITYENNRISMVETIELV